MKNPLGTASSISASSSSSIENPFAEVAQLLDQRDAVLPLCRIVPDGTFRISVELQGVSLQRPFGVHCDHLILLFLFVSFSSLDLYMDLLLRGQLLCLIPLGLYLVLFLLVQDLAPFA